MSLDTAIPARLAWARRFEAIAPFVMYLTMAAMFVLSLAQYFWFALVVVFAAMPAAWIYYLRCPSCAWLIYRVHGSAKPEYGKDQMLAPLYSKMMWRQPAACSKCGHQFCSSNLSSKAMTNADAD